MHRTMPGRRWRAAIWLAACALPACLCLPVHAQDQVETPVETTPGQTAPGQVTPPVTPVTPPETPTAPEQPVETREVLVRAQPNGPEGPRHQRLRIGPELSWFIPASASTRDRFGSTWFGIGVGLGSVHQEGLLGTWSGEAYLLSNSHKGSKAYVVPVGISYRRALVDRIGARPYVGASLDAVFTDFRSVPDDIGWGLRMGGGASALAGTTFGTRGFVEARYLITSRIKGLSFSGLNLTGGVRF